MEMMSKAMVAALFQQHERTDDTLEAQMEAARRAAEKEDRSYAVMTYEGNRKQRRIAASMARKHKQPTV